MTTITAVSIVITVTLVPFVRKLFRVAKMQAKKSKQLEQEFKKQKAAW